MAVDLSIQIKGNCLLLWLVGQGLFLLGWTIYRNTEALILKDNAIW